MNYFFKVMIVLSTIFILTFLIVRKDRTFISFSDGRLVTLYFSNHRHYIVPGVYLDFRLPDENLIINGKDCLISIYRIKSEDDVLIIRNDMNNEYKNIYYIMPEYKVKFYESVKESLYNSETSQLKDGVYSLEIDFCKEDYKRENGKNAQVGF